VATVVLSGPVRPRHLLVEGRHVVRDGQLATVDEEDISAEGHRVARRITAGAAR
jgi:hypothetical protein